MVIARPALDGDARNLASSADDSVWPYTGAEGSKGLLA